MSTYLGALRHVEGVLPLLEPRLYQTHSLRAFWSLLLPWPRVAFALYAVSTVAILVLAVRSLEKPVCVDGSLLGAVVGHGAGVTSFDRVRPDNPCAGLPAAR